MYRSVVYQFSVVSSYCILAVAGTDVSDVSVFVFLVITACTTSGCGRPGSLMVSALDSRSGGPGSSPGRGTALCSWARYFTLIVPDLSTQMYKWVPANLLLGITLRWTSIPSRGE